MLGTTDRSKTSRELAAYFGVGRDKVAEWVRRGLVTAINVGRGQRTSLRFTPESIRELEQRLKVQPTIRKPRPRVCDEDPEIAAFLDAE